MLRLAWRPLKRLPEEPTLKLDKPEYDRRRLVTAEEYAKILAAANPENPNVRWHITIQREAGMRPNDPKILTWPMVDLKTGVIRLPGHLVKEKKDRLTPISYELRRCFEEIKKARDAGVSSRTRHVLVKRNGKPVKSIRKSWQNIVAALKLKNCHQHGLRVAAVTEWENHGVPEPLARRWCGHRRDDVHSKYEDFTDEMHVEWFARAGFTLPPEKRGEGDFLLLKSLSKQEKAVNDNARF